MIGGKYLARNLIFNYKFINIAKFRELNPKFLLN